MPPQLCRTLIRSSWSLAVASVITLPVIADEPGTWHAVDESPSPSDAIVYVADDTTANDTAADAFPAEEAYHQAPAGHTGAVVLPPLAASGSDCNCAVSHQASCMCAAKQEREELAAAMKNAYKGVFYANSFAYLNSPLYEGPYFAGDALKGLAEGKLDLGGEFRSRYQSEHNIRGLGLTGRDDQFWLTRLRLFANYRLTENVRFYGEYLYADSGGETLAPRAIEENRGEAQNLFFDAKLTENLSVRAGRQELLFGAQRLISPLDWANTRRTFDGYRGTYTGDDWTIDGFYTHPVARVPATGGTNRWDNTNRYQQFYGAYATKLGAIGNANLDSYYLGYENDIANFSYHTLGSRLWGANDAFLYELEGGVQFGRNTNGSDHSDGFMTAGLGRKMNLRSWKPTLWLWYDWASGGDEPFNPGDDGFNQLFPLAHKYLGFMDLFGRRNINDMNLQFIAPISDRVTLLVWYHYFFLDQKTTPYNVNMTAFNTTTAAGSRDLGQEIDFTASVNLDPRNNLLFGYSFFNTGSYYRTTAGVPTTADASFFYCQYQSRF